MPALESLSPEVVYALKGNIAIPPDVALTAAQAATNAQSRLADAFVNPLEFAGIAAPTVTINAGSPKKANR